MSAGATTLRGTPVVVAPGKVFLVGEYAVLEGGPAVLAAIDRHAVAQYLPGFTAESPVVEQAVARATAALGELAHALPRGSVLVNTSAFRERSTKLGLGSSAAAAVSAVGAVFETAGLSLARDRDRLFALADEAHRAAQGGVGSGADVAAAVFGGVIRFQRPAGAAPIIDTIRLPPGLRVLVFWTGQAASTPDMIAAVRDLAGRAPKLVKTLMSDLGATAAAFVSEAAANQPRGVITAAGTYGRLLDELGSAAGVPIVTPALEQAMQLADSLGGAAKPSGAGGGDIGVALFSDPVAAGAFAHRCAPAATVLEVAIDESGVRRRGADTVAAVGHP